MPKAEQPESGSTPGEQFYSGALRRIGRSMPILALALTAAAGWKFGFRLAVGFICGCAIAYINFHWLKRVIGAFVDRATGSASRETGQGIVFRFLLRYVLMAVAAYAILTVSPASLNGLLAGLFLPVAAILCEAGYELYCAFIRGF
jgi:small-conductance mechanosensitive channel